jgi:hypothetical protein
LFTEDSDGVLSCLVSSSVETAEEQPRGEGSFVCTPDHLGGCNIDVLRADGSNGEKPNLGALMMPSTRGDLGMCCPWMAAGSCSGNKLGYFISGMVLRFSRMALMVGLSDGSLWRHLCTMLANVLAALSEN